MNNSFFGKTCENVRKLKYFKISRTEKRATKLINRPNCKRSKIYNENLVAFELQRETVELIIFQKVSFFSLIQTPSATSFLLKKIFTNTSEVTLGGSIFRTTRRITQTMIQVSISFPVSSKMSLVGSSLNNSLD